MTRDAPLTGLRVLDVTTAWAGPFAGRILAALGAEVVHLEAAARLDLWRGQPTGEHPERYVDGEPGADPINRNVLFNTQNLNKLSLALDVKRPGGRAALRAVGSRADVILSNFTPGTLARMGLDYAELAAGNPGLIVLEMPAFGTHGPMARMTSLGPGMEFASGMAAFVGYDAKPLPTGPAYLDPIGGYNAAAAIMTALHQRGRTGRGQWIEMSQCEAAMPLVAELILTALDTGTPPLRAGNERAGFVLHDAFPCAGEEAWVAIELRTEADWRGLLAAMARPDLAEDPRFASDAARMAHRETLAEIVSSWTVEQDKHALATRLQAAGLAAAPVNHGADVAADPHLAALGFVLEVTHPLAGPRRYQGLPFRFARAGLPAPRPAPLLGEHTEQVLRSWGGLSDAEIGTLQAAGTTSNKPSGDNG